MAILLAQQQSVAAVFVCFVVAVIADGERWLNKRALSDYNDDDLKLLMDVHWKNDNQNSKRLVLDGNNQNSADNPKDSIWPMLIKDTESGTLGQQPVRKPEIVSPKFTLHKYMVGNNRRNNGMMVTGVPGVELMSEEDMNLVSELFSERYRTVNPSVTVRPVLQHPTSQELSLTYAEYLLNSDKDLLNKLNVSQGGEDD